MFQQTFEFSDLFKVLTLSFIELLLSSDNAIVLGVITHSLPQQLRKKALLIGSLSAFVLRAAAILSLSYLLQFVWIQIVGGLYLLYLSAHYFFKRSQKSLSPQTRSFWGAVLLIELFDLLFAVDSILAGLAFIPPTDSGINPKLWIVYAGGMIGLFGIRFAARFFSDLIDKFPRLETSAHLLIGWIGLKITYQVLHQKFSYLPSLAPLFWAGLLLFFAFGFLKQKKPRT